MKLTASQLKQIIKEELDSMHESSEEEAPAGRPHKIKMSSHGLVLIHRDPTNPRSPAVNAPPGVAKLYKDLEPGQWEWVSDDYLNSVEPDPVTYSHGMFENSEENRILVIGSDREQSAWSSDKMTLGKALGILMTTAQRLGGRYKEGSAYKKRIKSFEEELAALQDFET